MEQEQTASDEEEDYRVGYREGFIAAYVALVDELEAGAGSEQILWHLFDFWQGPLLEWRHDGPPGEEAPEFRLADVVRRQPVTGKQRAAIVARCGRRCRYCRRVGTARHDADGSVWHSDHMVPLARGGTHTDDNLTLSCARCNVKKGAR